MSVVALSNYGIYYRSKIVDLKIRNYHRETSAIEFAFDFNNFTKRHTTVNLSLRFSKINVRLRTTNQNVRVT